MNMIFDICHMDMVSVYGVFRLQTRSLECLWIESFKNVVLSSVPTWPEFIKNCCESFKPILEFFPIRCIPYIIWISDYNTIKFIFSDWNLIKSAHKCTCVSHLLGKQKFRGSNP